MSVDPNRTTTVPAPPQPIAPSVLEPGIYVWLWPKSGWGAVDFSRVAADLGALGATGVIVQAGLDAPRRWDAYGTVLESAGLHVVCGLGMDGTHVLGDYVDAIVESVDEAGACMLDWEGRWDRAGSKDLANAIVDGVLARRSMAAERVTDCGWWAPLTTPDRHPTHPSAPTAEFGRLAARDRYPQCYGAPVDGASAGMLHWAQSPTQYAALGSWAIRPSYQMYRRSVHDQVDTLISEPTVCLWDWLECDDACKTALRAVKALRSKSFDGPGAVRRFQQSCGLDADNVCGALTLAALGV